MVWLGYLLKVGRWEMKWGPCHETGVPPLQPTSFLWTLYCKRGNLLEFCKRHLWFHIGAPMYIDMIENQISCKGILVENNMNRIKDTWNESCNVSA